MGASRNEFNIVAFDPGGTIGWTRLLVDRNLFCDPNNPNWLGAILKWKTGELQGTEHEQIAKCLRLIHVARFEPMPFVSDCSFVSEDFELTQIMGGKELVSPVRINAVLEWELAKQGLKLNYQSRSMRTNTTSVRLRRWGFKTKGKDSFASFQHAIVHLRRLKKEADKRPWQPKR